VFFKLLVDYKPRAALKSRGDRKAGARLAATGDQGSRKPWRQPRQLPRFPGSFASAANVAVDGWEADDILATLAHQTELNGLRACVVSTDRDAFQLVSDAVCLMMTPRGVADVEVYTPERVFARYGLSPAQMPDFIALKGDSADNIAAVPGIGEKTAAQLLAKYGSLEGCSATRATVACSKKALAGTPMRARGKGAATLRRDLDLGPDGAKLTLAPDRSSMLDTFRKFELKRLLERVALLDAAIPPAP
jgi:DNA polymerase-1